jgi:hypothetical protein
MAADTFSSFTRFQFPRRISHIPRRFGRISAQRRPLWRIISHRSGAGKAHGVLRAWIGWENFSNYLWPTYRVAGAPYGLLRMKLIRYRGRQIRLPDETTISWGDPLVELHCDNAGIVKLIRRGEINRYRACRQELAALARWVQTADAPVKALFGVTMLWWAAKRLGFSVRERHGRLRNALDRIFMAGLLLIYSTDGPNRAARGQTLDRYPHEVWISRDELIRRYAAAPAHPSSPVENQEHEQDLSTIDF